MKRSCSSESQTSSTPRKLPRYPSTKTPTPSTSCSSTSFSDNICTPEPAASAIPHQTFPRIVKRGLKRAGPYLLGPRIGSSPVHSIVQVLARKENTDDFYTLKILTLEEPNRETQDDRQGKMLMHTEYSLLSLLREQDGVVHHYGLFKDEAWEEREVPDQPAMVEQTGRKRKRICLVLDCLLPHDFGTSTSELVNLQHYVIKEKKLSEKEAIVIFYDIVRIVDNLHKKNIVHRDLKLGNMVLDKRTRRVTVTNFWKPYGGKPSDMWALGVVLFTMLYGQFPFYDCVPQELFRKIKSAEYTIPNDGRVSEATKMVICKLLVLDPQARMTAGQVLDTLGAIIAQWKASAFSNPLQMVPDVDDKDSCNDTKPEDTPANGTSDLEKRLFEIQNDVVLEHKAASTMSAVQPPRREAGHPTIHRLNVDAQPLVAADLYVYRALLPRQIANKQ
ncbi:hypothetical protein C0Q70_11816 [Pomacea canaliculata]|uniref:Serine/threonine-protein kinase 40 n=1 Tax=Pomacea canaliculata TaxID=400727 RepID=A0A2T7P741_POMCA|nr:hypothetical protein C0Q70_11816 [Pomacea canaliculata]